MARIEHEIEIARPPEQVFGQLAHMERVPQWLADRGTRLRASIEPSYGGFLKLLAPLTRRMIARKFPKQLERLRSQVEAGGG